MKKFISFIITIAALISVAACGPNTSSEPVNSEIKKSYSSMPEAETATKNMEEKYIGNKITKKFHRSDCRSLPSEKNTIEFLSRSEAVDRGYSPCGNCNP